MRKILKSGPISMGVCGTPTSMTDSFGEKLYVGDIVNVWYAEPAPEGRSLNAEDPEFVVQSEGEEPFIMGMKGSYQLQTRYYLNGEESNEENYDYAESYYHSESGFLWMIKKIKDHKDTVHRERWGSGNVTVFLEKETGDPDGIDGREVSA